VEFEFVTVDRFAMKSPLEVQTLASISAAISRDLDRYSKLQFELLVHPSVNVGDVINVCNNC
jgi:hypothetical protein